jgi:DNA-binding MarR family transcriptional regulator
MITGREVARALRASYLALHRQTNACLAKDGVTADQFVLLATLAEADAVTQQELVRRVGSDPSTMRAMLLLLERRGLVTRDRHPADGRARCVTLTEKGRQAFKKLWTRSEHLRVRLLAAFQPDEVTALVELLGRLAEVMASPASTGSRTTSGTGARFTRSAARRG